MNDVTMWGKYSSFFLYFRIFLLIFNKYMKNKIGILENEHAKNVHLTNNTIHYWKNLMYISFFKMPIFIYLEKIANIRKYRKNDEYFPHSE